MKNVIAFVPVCVMLILCFSSMGYCGTPDLEAQFANGIGDSTKVLEKQSPLWETRFEEKLESFAAIDADLLIAYSKDEFAAVDAKTGGTLWSVKDTGAATSYRVYPGLGTEYLLVDRGIECVTMDKMSTARTYGERHVISFVNRNDGTEIWRSDKLGINDAMGWFLTPDSEKILIFAQDSAQNGIVMLADFRKGKTIWQNNTFFGDCSPNLIRIPGPANTLNGNQNPVFDSTGTMITFLDKCSVKKWSMVDGSLIWETNLGAHKPPALVDCYAPILSSAGGERIFVPYDNRVTAIDTKDGRILWTNTMELPGRIHQMVLTGKGLLIKGGYGPKGREGDPYVWLINDITGEPRWPKPYKKLGDMPNVLFENERVVVYSNGCMYSISLEDGSFMEFGGKLKFKGYEYPEIILSYENGYLLASAQNLVLIDQTGTQVYHSFYQAPSMALLPVPDFGQVRRLKATTYAAGYIYFLTKVEVGSKRGNGIVKVRLSDGTPVSEILLDDWSANYLVNSAGTRLYFLRGTQTLQCYAF